MLTMVALLTLGGCSSQESTESAPVDRKCNGSEDLCSRRYDQVTYAATHNAYSYAEGGPVAYSFANQDKPIPDQLAYGIRAFGIRPCPYQGKDEEQMGVVFTTHNCSLKGFLGQEPLVDVLIQVREFLEKNPREVVTLLAESAVTPAEVASVFEQAGLGPYLYEHEPSKGWPTLGTMIEQGKRLVVFNDSQEASRPAWQLYMWDFIVDTDYNVSDPSQFSCAYYRGKPSNDLYFLNQFIYDKLNGNIDIPSKEKAQIANEAVFAENRARQCKKEMGRLINFIYVDWYGQGNVKAVVDSLNHDPL
jgi:hypothetical protein